MIIIFKYQLCLKAVFAFVFVCLISFSSLGKNNFVQDSLKRNDSLKKHNEMLERMEAETVEFYNQGIEDQKKEDKSDELLNYPIDSEKVNAGIPSIVDIDTTKAKQKYKLYQDIKQRYSFQLPVEWDVIDDDEMGLYILYKRNGENPLEVFKIEIIEEIIDSSFMKARGFTKFKNLYYIAPESQNWDKSYAYPIHNLNCKGFWYYGSGLTQYSDDYQYSHEFIFFSDGKKYIVLLRGSENQMASSAIVKKMIQSFKFSVSGK